MTQDPHLEIPSSSPVQSEICDQVGAGALIDLERVRLSPRSVQREHQLTSQALAGGLSGQQRFDLGDYPGVAAEPQVSFDPRLERAEAQLLEPADLSLREVLETELGQRPAAPRVPAPRAVTGSRGRGGLSPTLAVRPAPGARTPARPVDRDRPLTDTRR